MRTAETTSGPAADSAADAPAAAAGVRRRILVVDDHRDAARILSLLLDTLGHEVRTAADGRQALDQVAAFNPDVIFLDISLPGADGYEVARQLRELPDGKGRKLIALTGWGQEEDRRRSREAGFDQHLVKPVSAATLRQVLGAS